jgi:hypothetical protein
MFADAILMALPPALATAPPKPSMLPALVIVSVPPIPLGAVSASDEPVPPMVTPDGMMISLGTELAQLSPKTVARFTLVVFASVLMIALIAPRICPKRN